MKNRKEDNSVKQSSRLVELEPVSKVERICWKIGFALLTVIVIVLGYRAIPEKEVVIQNTNQRPKKNIAIMVKIEPDFSYADEISREINVQSQDLIIIDRKLVEVSKLIGQMEEAQNLGTLMESISSKLEDVGKLINKVRSKCDSIHIKCGDSTYESINPIKETVNHPLNSSLTDGLNLLLCDSSESTETKKLTSEETERLQASLSEVEQEYNSAYKLYNGLYRDFMFFDEQQKLQNTKESLKEKLASVKISTRADLSKPIGFTEDELRYFLLCINELNALKRQDIQIPEEVIELLPRIIVEFVKDHPMNEFFVISVMGWESGHCNSDYAKERNNFFGMKSRGEGMYFNSVREGLEEGVQCVYNHLEGKKTIHQVNDTYRPYQKGKEEKGYERYSWSEGVMSVMWLYKGVEID